VLSDAGIHVVTADSFRGAAAAANTHLKTAPLSLILADVAVAGTLPWVEKVLRTCPAVLVGVELTGNQSRIAGNTSQVSRLPAPVDVDMILAAIGLDPLGAGMILTTDGTITGGPIETPVVTSGGVDLDILDDVDDTAGLEQEEPVAATPTPAEPMVDFLATAAAAPVVPIPSPLVAPESDLWEEDEEPGPIPYTPPTQTGWAPPPVPSQSVSMYLTPQVGTPTPAPVADVRIAETLTPPSVQWTDQHTADEPPAHPLIVAERIGVEDGYSATLGRSLAPVIFTIAGKGGVGKTSLALALAQRAALIGNMRAVLIDGNRGQGDLRTYLSLGRSGLPTIYDALTSGDPATAIVTPDRLNANRPADAEQLAIALVQAPPRGLTDPTTITATLYGDVITAARSMSDLVVIDTQIVEGSERGMFDELIIPMLAAHAYGLGIADLSKPGVDNLIAHLSEFISQGVPVARLMTMLNRVPDTTKFDQQRTAEALSRFGQFLAAVPADAGIHSAMAYGLSIQDNPALSPLLDQVLMKVTGNPVFAAHTQQLDSRAPTKRRGRLRWGRR
jgi:cellulose biosynthesis protein BcsQ